MCLFVIVFKMSPYIRYSKICKSQYQMGILMNLEAFFSHKKNRIIKSPVCPVSDLCRETPAADTVSHFPAPPDLYDQ